MKGLQYQKSLKRYKIVFVIDYGSHDSICIELTSKQKEIEYATCPMKVVGYISINTENYDQFIKYSINCQNFLSLRNIFSVFISSYMTFWHSIGCYKYEDKNHVKNISDCL